MKKRLHHTYLYMLLGIVLSLGLLTSCSSFIEIDQPIHIVTTTTVFEDEQTATSAVMGLYSKMLMRNFTFSSGATTIFAGLASDEFYHTGTLQDLLVFYTNSYTENSGTISEEFWRFTYEYIYQANICIEGLQSSSISSSTKNQLLGEVYTIRAFCYWYLVNLFGDVPLILSSNYEENATIGRTNSGQVIEQIVLDLETARDMLIEAYQGNDRERINKWTAVAFLARVYLYQGNWALAEQYASEVIGVADYRLEEDLNKVFLIESEEVIWRLVERTEPFEAPRETAHFIPVSLPPNRLPICAIADNLIESFESEDQRMVNWTAARTVGGTTYTYPFKFKDRYRINGLTESLAPFRLAETYLIRSEARAQLNDLTSALEDLNIIRNRSGLGNLHTSDRAELLDLILKERQIELFAEWGHRWFDLKRTGKIDAVLGEVKPNWRATSALWPIPYSQILLNPNLTQNEGYNQ